VPGAAVLSDAPQLRGSYRLTRLLFLRLLSLIYGVAFLVLAQQLRSLIGANGLLPAHDFLGRIGAAGSARLSTFAEVPTVFWLNDSDSFMVALAYVGVGLSLLVLLGFANALLLATLWFLYLSFYHVGQLFWGYGWELLLLETGFLAIFLCPLFDARPVPTTAPPRVVIWLLRWGLFRVMFGAGLIKLRGDPCWRDLSCMFYHYETQPLPNPLSWYLHQLPPVIHEIEVLFNHFVELIVPWTLFAPRRLRHIGGVFLVAFQVLLIVSGNLSWLNWLTITLCIACFDDQALSRIVPRRLRARLLQRSLTPPTQLHTLAADCLAALVVYLSIGPVVNLLGSRQVMNGSFDRLHLVNTYGAFGSVGKRRSEVILEGTRDAAITDTTQWQPYEFKCKPGDVYRRPCIVAPYHYRADWQIWFAAMSVYQHQPWLVHFVAKLLEGDAGALSLLANNPFPDAPPRFVRAELYEYAFTHFGDTSGAWWTRQRVGPYLPPVSLDSPGLRMFLRNHGWEEGG
jgi:lipase maturation factor